MMDPRNEQEEEVKKYYSVPVHNFVRRFKLINATFRKEAGSTDVLIDVTRQRGWIRIVSVVCLRTENIDSINNKKKKEKKGEKRARERKISMLRPLVTLAKTGLTRNVSSGRFIIITWMFFIIIIVE